MGAKKRVKPSDIEKLYKEQAQEYSHFADSSFSWLYLEKPVLDKVLAPFTNKHPKILDAGCGSGRVLRYLLSRNINSNDIVGVDICEDMLAIARKNAPNVTTVRSDLVTISLKSHFDLILCTHVLHYLDSNDYKRALRNLYKLLNPDGTLLLVLTHPVRTTRHNLENYFLRDWIVDHTPWGTNSPLFLRPISDMVNEVIRTGFTVKSLEEPSVPAGAEKSDPHNYAKYSCCPSRIAVIAIK